MKSSKGFTLTDASENDVGWLPLRRWGADKSPAPVLFPKPGIVWCDSSSHLHAACLIGTPSSLVPLSRPSLVTLASPPAAQIWGMLCVRFLWGFLDGCIRLDSSDE